MAASSFVSSISIMTNTASSRLSYSPVRVGAVLRPSKRPSGTEIRAHLRRLARAIRSNWPHTRILIRSDGHYCSPQVIDWCRTDDIDFIFGAAPTTTLRKHVVDLETSTMVRFEVSVKTGKVRRFKEFLDGAGSWSRVRSVRGYLHHADRTSAATTRR